MTTRRFDSKTEAWLTGYRNGRADKMLGYRSLESLHSPNADYAQGYRLGQEETETWSEAIR